MGIDSQQLKKYIIEPTLKEIGLESDSATNILLGTCAQETQMGKYLHQINGTALGIYQMEKITFLDIRDRYLFKRTHAFRQKVEFCCKLYVSSCEFKDLMWNLNFATIMARLKYASIGEPLPAADNIKSLAEYWKKYYNTAYGKGTVKQFIENYKRYVK